MREYASRFGGEWLGEDHPGYECLVAGHWNGWCVPAVTRTVAQRVAAENNVAWDELRRTVATDNEVYEIMGRFSWETEDGTIVLVLRDQGSELEGYAPTKVRPRDDGRYILDFGWTWDELDEPEETWHVYFTDHMGRKGTVAGWFASYDEALASVGGALADGCEYEFRRRIRAVHG